MLSKKAYIEPEFMYRDSIKMGVILGSGVWSDSSTNEFGQDDFYGEIGGGNNG